MLPHWLRHTYREVTWSGPQQGLIGIPYWEQHQFVIADLGTVRFLDVWSFSGETILVLSKNLYQQLSGLLRIHQECSSVCNGLVQWTGLLFSSLVSLWRTFIETILLSGMSAKVVQFAQGLLSSMVSLFWSHSTAQVWSSTAMVWDDHLTYLHLSGLYWCICIFVVLDFVYLYLLLSSLLKELFHISSLLHQYEYER